MKSKKYKYKSYKENGVRYLECDTCGIPHPISDVKVVKVVCSRCINLLIPIEETTSEYKPSGKPAGWHFMKEFVDKDGNVFHKGKEQPKLKGTLSPTQIKPRKKTKRKSKEDILIGLYKKRKKAQKKNKSKVTSSYEIGCSKCKEIKKTSKARKEKLIVHAGSIDKLEKTYLCRKCKGEMKK